MKKYKVLIRAIAYATLEVEADSEVAAEEKAQEKWDDGEDGLVDLQNGDVLRVTECE